MNPSITLHPAFLSPPTPPPSLSIDIINTSLAPNLPFCPPGGRVVVFSFHGLGRLVTLLFNWVINVIKLLNSVLYQGGTVDVWCLFSPCERRPCQVQMDKSGVIIIWLTAHPGSLFLPQTASPLYAGLPAVTAKLPVSRSFLYNSSSIFWTASFPPVCRQCLNVAIASTQQTARRLQSLISCFSFTFSSPCMVGSYCTTLAEHSLLDTIGKCQYER